MAAAAGIAADTRGTVQAIVRTARERLVGQRVTVSLADSEATMTVLDVDTTQGTASLAQGRLETLRLTAADVTDSGAVRLRWSRWPRRGYLEVVSEVMDAHGTLLLRPRTVGVAGYRMRPPRRLHAIRVPMPWLPRNFRLTEIATGNDHVVFRVVADRWHHRLSTAQLLDLLDAALSSRARHVVAPSTHSRPCTHRSREGDLKATSAMSAARASG